MSESSCKDVDIIDLTEESTIHEKTITIDDSIVVCTDDDDEDDDNDCHIHNQLNSSTIQLIKDDLTDHSSPTIVHSQPEVINCSQSSSSLSPSPEISYSQPHVIIESDGSASSPPPCRSAQSTPSPKKKVRLTPSFNRARLTPKVTKAAAKQQAKELREKLRRDKERQKEEDKVQKEANRANAANKALDNCTANIDINILKIVNDPDEETFKTLFDESMIKYHLTDYPKVEDSIFWTYKRVEVENGICVAKYKDANWIMIIMHGSDYLKRLLAYKTDPDNPQSLKTYLSDIRRRTGFDVILLVFNLAAHLKSERAKEAKNYRATFKNRFEGNQGPSEVLEPVSTIGTTELQDNRLMLEIDFKRKKPDWKLHIEFYEKKMDIIQSIVRYTLSIARYEVKQKARSSTGLDWAINMDKERATDPTKSKEDLTKLWMTQLQQFSQVTLPIAKAIAADYPSPCALLDQYQSLTPSEAEGLLAQLYVQRNLKRQIGMAISRRIHCFMTSEDPNIHIGLS